MNKATFSRTVRFRDDAQIAWTVECELREIDRERINRVTLQPYYEAQEVSLHGDGPHCGGQIYDHIIPRTEGQKKLIDLWNRFHLCNMCAGTDKQEEYLRSSEYKADYDKFVASFSGYDKDFRKHFDDVAWKILQNVFQYDIMAEPWVRKVVNDMMNGNPIMYILGDDEKDLFFCRAHDHTNYYVECLFLAMKGLYNDRGYLYGHDWLYEPLPTDIKQMINDLFDQIEAEEAELTESLDPTFDMGAEDFEATPEIINQVMELRNCDETEAKRFLALGMFLGYTFGDLDNTFEEVDETENLYRVDGTEYYVGTDEELEAVAWGHLEDGDYDYLWREAVQAEQTELGLQDWFKQVVDLDGWCHILNSWDGKHEDFKIGGEWICVSRT